MDMEYEYNLLLHIDSDDVKTLDLALANAHHFLTAFTDETIRLVLIVNGPGVKLITTQYPEQAKKASEMARKGASVMVCGNALKAYEMDNSELWPDIEVVSNGIVEIVRLQNEGMAYVKP